MAQSAKRRLDEYEDHSTITTEHITLIIKSENGRQFYFKVCRSVPLQRLLHKYCELRKVDYETIQFIFDGACINGKRTPEQLGMEDGSEIDAWTHKMGGGHLVYH